MVHLNSQQPPLFVAYRDGFVDVDRPAMGPAWQVVPQPGTAVSFTVHGAYSVTVVCGQGSGPFLVWQTSRTTDDNVTKTQKEPMVSTPCGAAPTTHTVSGTLVKAGVVHLGGQDQTVATDGGSFSFSVPDGTYYLTATTGQATDTTPPAKIALQHVVVNGANMALSAPVDVAAGLTTNPIKLEVDNPPNPDTSKEKVTARVEVMPKDGAVSSLVYLTPALDPGADKMNQVFPDVVSVKDADLMDGDTQSATMIGRNSKTGKIQLTGDVNEIPRATDITTMRSFNQAFTMDSDLAKGLVGQGISLPSNMATPAPKFDKSTVNGENQLSVALPSLPSLDELTVTVTGKSAANADITYMADITDNYFTATLLARPVFETDLTGFQSIWKIDFSQQFQIDLTSQADVFDDDDNFVGHAMSEFTEVVETKLVPPM